MTTTAYQPSVRAVSSWVLYDLANTIFSMGVVSLFFPMLVREAVGAERADRTLGLILALSMGVIFVVSPLLGALSDRAPRRMPFLVASTLVCVGFTLLMARAGFWWAAACFVVANIAYQAGLQFYDALLPEVSTVANRGRIGGIGVSVGYLGSFLAVALSLLITDNLPRLLTIVALLFLLFALPCFWWVRERANQHPRTINARAVVESTRDTVNTLRAIGEFPGLLRFLIGRACYTDAINTVIQVMFLYTINVVRATGFTDADGPTPPSIV